MMDTRMFALSLITRTEKALQTAVADYGYLVVMNKDKAGKKDALCKGSKTAYVASQADWLSSNVQDRDRA